MRKSKAESARLRRMAWELFEQGKNQQQIADSIGVTQKTVSTYLNGDKNGSAEKPKIEDEIEPCDKDLISITLPCMARVGDTYEYRFGSWKLSAQKVSSGRRNT